MFILNSSGAMSEEPIYLGGKGYTVRKDAISSAEAAHIREDLMARPKIHGAPVQPRAFPIYRESVSKFYIPRYYGNATYGIPACTRLPEPTSITVEFAGELREYQRAIVWRYLKAVESPGVGGGVISVPCGRGKTVIALAIISSMKLKTLVIVHKGFLVNQWKERIEQFIPGASVGKIQGQIIDVDGHDIVIGMLQSLSMKEYPRDLFGQFGLLIVDECHHISSEVFSRSLSNIVVSHTLGLSATMDRKDGLTPVFKMFLGDTIYEEQREQNKNVLVKAISYSSDSDKYGNEICDPRGQPSYSSMISEICRFDERTAFISHVIGCELANYDGQQVLVLAQQKDILLVLARHLEENSIPTGFYLGGMKQAALHASEKASVVLATYAMAAEALDIKSLTTLVLATPRTDVVQAVGRILRCPHLRPLIIDIVDAYPVFMRQWEKRMKYYNKNKYQIEQCESANYGGPWTTIAQDGKRLRKNSPMKGKCLISSTSLEQARVPI